MPSTVPTLFRLVADDPLGLRPEMTASIARAACTRFAGRQRPLRLWASGTVFRTRAADEGGQSIEENLQSGVELFGVSGSEAEMELLSLLMAAVQTLGLQDNQKPRLLLGHTALMDLLLRPFSGVLRDQIRTALIDFDRLAIENIDLADVEKTRLLSLLDCRGTPDQVLSQLASLCGEQPVFEELRRLCAHLSTAAQAQAVTIQLDPTFQPHFELYTGLVFQLVCDGRSFTGGDRPRRPLRRSGAALRRDGRPGLWRWIQPGDRPHPPNWFRIWMLLNSSKPMFSLLFQRPRIWNRPWSVSAAGISKAAQR